MKNPAGRAEGAERAAGAKALGQPRLVCWRPEGGAESQTGDKVKGWREGPPLASGLVTLTFPLREMRVLAV